MKSVIITQPIAIKIRNIIEEISESRGVCVSFTDDVNIQAIGRIQEVLKQQLKFAQRHPDWGIS